MRPLLTTAIGFVRPTRRAICQNRRGFPKLSMYIRITRVAGSASQYSSRSLPETSALFPMLANCEMPIPRSRARSRIATPSAPDCEESDTPPCGGQVGAKVASIEMAGSVLRIPRQFGPISRIPCACTRAIISSWRARPAGPVSPKPALITTTPRTPLRPQSSIAGSTRFCGTTRIARSTGSGISRTVPKARTDCTDAAPGLTG